MNIGNQDQTFAVCKNDIIENEFRMFQNKTYVETDMYFS